MEGSLQSFDARFSHDFPLPNKGAALALYAGAHTW
jgi:hypothetical protein